MVLIGIYETQEMDKADDAEDTFSRKGLWEGNIVLQFKVC